jgi:hypothetical protein
VFRDFVLAWALSREREDLAGLVRETMATPDFLPSPFLAFFALHFQEQGHMFSARDVGWIIESVRSGARIQDDLEFSVDDVGTGLLEVTAFRADERDRPTTFDVRLGAEEGVEIVGRLSSAALDVNCPVTLWSRGQTFYIGPDTYITTARLSVTAPELRVLAGRSSSSDRGTTTIAATSFDYSHLPQVRVDHDAELHVLVEDDREPLRHPWVPYSVKTKDRPGDVKEFGYEIIDALRSMAIQRLSFIDLSREHATKKFAGVIDELTEAGIVRGTTKQVSGQPRLKPEVVPEMRKMLIDSVPVLARWELPEAIRQRLRAVHRS